ncbi:MAG TPA: hypothetical protein VGE07_06940, partial [Herpetosiphonaceae bacterium]
MTGTQLDGRLERWRRRIETLSGGSAYLLLAVSALLALLEDGQSWGQRAATLGLAAAAAGWMLWMVTLHPQWAGRRRLMGAYYLGLLALMAALIARSPWFGIFAFTGYLHGWSLLAGGWRIAAVTGTAMLSAIWQLGGLPEPTAAAIVSSLVFVALVVGLVVLFSSMGEVTAAQNRERKRVIGELAAANERLEAMLVENAGLQAQVLAQAREAGMLDERQR